MTLIPPHFMNTVVAIGEVTNGDFRCGATGFLYAYPSHHNDDGEQLYYYLLVTNRHVVDQGYSPRAIKTPMARLNLATGKATQPYQVDLWIPHPGTLDVAVAPLKATAFTKLGIDYQVFASDRDVLRRQQVLDETGIREGNGIYVLGFPLELAGQERNYVIARQGILARVQDWLRGDEETFLIDASIFPGNSGGPVLTKPEVIAIGDITPYGNSRLIGMVASYVPYNDMAISKQTGEPRVMFQENSGLGRVIPVDAIEETVVHALKVAKGV